MSFEQEYEVNTSRWIEPDASLVDCLTGHRPGRALDLGAGEGGNSFWLAEQGWDVTSVDLSPSAVSFIDGYAKERGYSIQAEVADGRTYKSEDPFDFILLSFVHFSKEERIGLFARLKAQLKEGGYLVYLGLIKDENELPPGGRLEEFPSSDVIAAEMKELSVFKILEQKDQTRDLPIGVLEGTYTARTAYVNVQKKER